GSLGLDQVDLTGAKTVGEMQRLIADYASSHGNAPWILGRGWSYTPFGKDALPHKKFLDEVVFDRPVYMDSFDLHTSWANSKALELAGISRQTPDPPNGEIVRDPETGEPTGALKEDASGLIQKVLPKPTQAEKLEALKRGLHEANRVGLTRVHSCGGDFEVLDLLEELRRQNQLTVRMVVAYSLEPPKLTREGLNTIEDARHCYSDDWLATGAVKLMLDGVVESHTAAMIDPYADDPSQHGKLFWEPENYKEAVIELDRLGFQLFTHAIGERAVRLA